MYVFIYLAVRKGPTNERGWFISVFSRFRVFWDSIVFFSKYICFFFLVFVFFFLRDVFYRIGNQTAWWTEISQYFQVAGLKTVKLCEVNWRFRPQLVIGWCVCFFFSGGACFEILLIRLCFFILSVTDYLSNKRISVPFLLKSNKIIS